MSTKLNLFSQTGRGISLKPAVTEKRLVLRTRRFFLWQQVFEKCLATSYREIQFCRQNRSFLWYCC